MEFCVPAVEQDVTSLAAAAIQLGALASRLAIEERTAVFNTDGRRENVAEHSHMLSIVAPALAMQFFPELDAGKVALLCPIHDVVEAYAGDTPTLEIDEQGLAKKALREQQGRMQLNKDYAHLQTFITLVDEYETQEIPEARFVRAVDKLMPLLIHIYDDCAGLQRIGHTPEQILTNSAKRAAQLRAEYPDMEAIITTREELAEYVAARLRDKVFSQA